MNPYCNTILPDVGNRDYHHYQISIEYIPPTFAYSALQNGNYTHRY